MNVRNDLQPLQSLDRDIQVSLAGKSAGGFGEFSPLASNDEAHLSSEATLATQVASLQEVRSEKVAAIQLAIANGSYSVSSTDVAQSLIGHMLDGKE